MRLPVQWSVDHGEIVTVRSLRGFEHHRAVFHRAADGTDLVHGPTQSHGAVAADAAVRGTKANNAASGAGRDDGAERLGADGKSDEAARSRRSRPGRRSAGALLDVPRIPGHAAEPQ